MGAQWAGGRKLRFATIPLSLLLLCFVGHWGKLFTKVEIFGASAKQVFVKFCGLQQFGLILECFWGYKRSRCIKVACTTMRNLDVVTERSKSGGRILYSFGVGSSVPFVVCKPDAIVLR